jgi:hypothetical protein
MRGKMDDRASARILSSYCCVEWLARSDLARQGPGLETYANRPSRRDYHAAAAVEIAREQEFRLLLAWATRATIASLATFIPRQRCRILATCF